MITISLLICLIGLALWGVCTNFKRVESYWVAELGRISFFAGLLAWLFSAGSKVAL
jgi:hypothetical protein